MNTREIPAPILHQIAQALCFAKHGDWRYDPGNPKHRKWFDRAGLFAVAAGLTYERVGNGDGRGSSPPRQIDRGQSYRVRLVGGWVNEVRP